MNPEEKIQALKYFVSTFISVTENLVEANDVDPTSVVKIRNGADVIETTISGLVNGAKKALEAL